MAETYLWTGAASNSLDDGGNWLDQGTDQSGTIPGPSDRAAFMGDEAVTGTLAVSGLSSTAAPGDSGLQFTGTLSVGGIATFAGNATVQDAALNIGTALELGGSGDFALVDATLFETSSGTFGDGEPLTIDVGNTAASPGSYRLDVSGSTVGAQGGALSIGDGSGALSSVTLDNGSTLLTGSATLGAAAGFGVLQILSGSAGSFTTIDAGTSGFGGINVFGLSMLTSDSVTLGAGAPGGSGGYGVMRIAASIVNAGDLTVGSSLYGLVQVDYHGVLNADTVSVGVGGPSAAGTLEANASSVNVSGSLTVGSGYVLVDNGGALCGYSATLGAPGGGAELQVTNGSQAAFILPDTPEEGGIDVGQDSYGSVEVTGLSSLTCGGLIVGNVSVGGSSTSADGLVQVGASILQVNSGLVIGNAGTGLVQAGYGGAIYAANVTIGNDASGGVGTLLAEGTDTVLSFQTLDVANGAAEVGYGASLDCNAGGGPATAIRVGFNEGDSASMTIGLASATVTSDVGLLVGSAGVGNVQILASSVTFAEGGSGSTFVGVGSIQGTPTFQGSDGSGTLGIDDGSTVQVDGTVSVGNVVTGELDISNMSALTAGNLVLGQAAGASGASAAATLSGGSVANVSGTVTLDGFSTLSITDQGTMLNASNLQAGANSTIDLVNGAVVTVGDASLAGNFLMGGSLGASLSVLGTLGISADCMLAGAGQVSAPAIQLNGVISATGEFISPLSVTGDISGTGTLLVNYGSLLVLAGGADGSAGGQAATVQFRPTATVQAASTAALAEHIAGWSTGDIISLTGIDATQGSYANGVLTLSDNAGDVLGSLNFTGSYTQANFAVSSSASSGTTISFHG